MQSYNKIFAKVYNKRWRQFSEVFAPKIHSFFESQREKVGLSKTLLDLCCGTGQLTNFFLKQGYSVFGIDLSPHMIKYAKENNVSFIKKRKAYFSVQDAKSFKLKTSVSFVISLYDALNHLPDLNTLQSCFNHVYKHLDQNGLFLFDLNTQRGLLRWNRMMMQEDEETTLMIKGIFTKDMPRAYTNISGYIKNNSGTYDRFTEIVYNTVFTMNKVKTALQKAHFRKIYFSNPDIFFRPIENPEKLDRVFIVAQK